MVLNLIVYVRNAISFFYKQKKKKKKKTSVKFWYLELFWQKNSSLAYISLKIGKLGKICNNDVIHGMFVLFWHVWKEETHGTK